MQINRRNLYRVTATVSIILGLLAGDKLLFAGERIIPGTMPSHPGNIFLAGEKVIISAPPGEVTTWRMNNYDDQVIAKGKIENGKIDLGRLPVGYYKIVRGAPGQYTNRTWIGVLEPLRSPTPKTSPINIDVGVAWFFPQKEKMEEVARLCELAGINRVRDRLLWGEMEPKRGEFVPVTRYDLSAQVQAAAGLQVLQVCHVSAPWATANTQRFPPDLRDIYNFYREVARRWEKEVGAFEPWNEADIKDFGGHTGSEMASYQKAAYLGLKAGNPRVTACMNVFAIRRAETLRDFQGNRVWPYYDTYNLHHYEALQNYPSLYADHRAVSGGKPMWVSECDVHVHWRGDERYKELSEADLRLQSEQLLKTYALGLHEGAEAIFYFVLPHYSERKIQYGLLRPDLCPRPGYVALAAVGRLLADAKALGRVRSTNDSFHGYLFKAKPDGKPSDVLVLWSENETTLALPKSPQACFDHLGRVIPIQGRTLKVSRAPIYALLSEETALDLIAPPKPPKLLTEKPGNLVLQALLPEGEIVLEKSGYKMGRGETKSIPVYLYNFGATTLHGKLKITVPKLWSADFAHKVHIAPGERQELTLKLSAPKTESWIEGQVLITGDFATDQKPVLSMHFVPGSK